MFWLLKWYPLYSKSMLHPARPPGGFQHAVTFVGLLSPPPSSRQLEQVESFSVHAEGATDFPLGPSGYQARLDVK